MGYFFFEIYAFCITHAMPYHGIGYYFINTSADIEDY